MANLIPCPICAEDIENDSIFCDQCGAELMKCPKCGNFRKGKFCPTCGVATVKASEAVATPQQPQAQAAPQPTPPQPTPTPVIQPGAQYLGQPIPSTNPEALFTGTAIPGAGNAPTPTRLYYRAMGVVIPLQPGGIIGRVNGNYVAQVSSLNYISGTHARLDFNGGQWSITDLGSRNGTTVNGIPCTPTQAIKIGDVVRFARSYDFYVE